MRGSQLLLIFIGLLFISCDNSKKYYDSGTTHYYHIEAYNGTHLYAILKHSKHSVEGHLYSKQNGFIQVKGPKQDSLIMLQEIAPSGKLSGKYSYRYPFDPNKINWYSPGNSGEQFQLKWDAIDSATFYSKLSYLSTKTEDEAK